MDPQASLVYSSRMTSLFKMPQWFHVAHHQESTCSQYSFPRADITKVHTLGVLKQQKYIFLTVLEARSLRPGFQHSQFPVRAFFLAWTWLRPSHCVLTWQRERASMTGAAGRSLLFLLRPPILSDQGTTPRISLNLNHLLKALSQNAAILKAKASTYARGWGHSIQFVIVWEMLLKYEV